MRIEPGTISKEISKTEPVLGTHMHYLEKGSGKPILFLHGIPNSSYVWRHVIPFLSDLGRTIALDLIGMGDSGKPDIEYTVFDHIRYVEAFIDALNLKDITLVLHAWGSVIGFDIAMRRPELFNGIAFVEAQVRPMSNVLMLPLPMQEMLNLAHDMEGTKKRILESTYFIDRFIPAASLHAFTPEEMTEYRRPFLEPGTRKPLWQFIMDLPKGEKDSPVLQLIQRYSEALQHSSLPKLMIYAVPGYNTSMETVQWAKDHFPHLTLQDVGEAFHYPQEHCPDKVGEALRDWYSKVILKSSK